MSHTNSLTIKKAASLAIDSIEVVEELYQGTNRPESNFALFYCSPAYDLDELGVANAMQSDIDKYSEGCNYDD